MRDEILPVARPSITEREIEAVAEVLRSGWITSGPRVESFERAFAARVGAAGAVAVSSATAGFHLLLDGLGIGRGDEVITPSLTWPSPVNMIHHAGATPVFADVDPGTWQLDPADVERRVTPRTRAVVAVHFAGLPCDLERLRELCERRGLLLVEDAAHAAGGEHAGRPIGCGPGPAVFSFHAAKNLATGEGGMVTLGDEALIARIRRQRFHGVDRDAWKRRAGGDGTPPGRDYDLDKPGWKYVMTDLQAALGLVQLERLEAMVGRRRELAALYDELLAGVSGIVPQSAPSYDARHARHLYPVLVEEERAGIDRDAFRRALRERGIGTGLHYLAVHELAFYRRRRPDSAGALARTERISARIVSLPLFADMTEADARDVVAAVEEVVG